MIAQGYGKSSISVQATAFSGIRDAANTSPARAASWRSRARSRARLGEHGISVNTLAPGFPLRRQVLRRIPISRGPRASAAVQSRSLRRDEHPQELLGAMVSWRRRKSDFVTGQTLGGRRRQT